MTEEYKEKWQKEFEIYHSFKSTFILEGEIFDKRPLVENGDLTLVSLDEFIYHELQGYGYNTIVYFNHVDGFYNRFDSKAVSRFGKIVKKSAKDNETETIELTSTDRNSKFGEATELIRNSMKNDSEPVAIVMNLASRYVEVADNLKTDEQYFYTELLLATQDFANPMVSGSASDGAKKKKRLNNILILIANKTNDIPVWFFMNNPRVKAISLCTPDKKMREYFLNSYLGEIYGVHEITDEKELQKAKEAFVDLTEGLRNVDLELLIQLMNEEKISLKNIHEAISIYKYGIRENPWTNDDIKNKLDTLEESLKERVKGQEVCIHKVTDIVTRAVLGLSDLSSSSGSQKPKGIMFFAGPTGTGKTELAKSLAEWLFGTEEAMIRFDMSEYSQSHSDQKLLGAPPGYIGYEEGGQLTNAVKKRPFSILLFDEIEKADGTILDKFLQILEDGRMTDGKGETVYFSDTIIIFTSNLGITKTNRMTGVKEERIVYDGVDIIDSTGRRLNDDYDAYKDIIMEGVTDYFIHDLGRPEIKNRIGDNFIIFEFISPGVAKLILDSQLKKIHSNLLQQRNIDLTFSDEAKRELFERKIISSLKMGGRGVKNAVEGWVINPLASFLASHHISSDKSIFVKHFVENDSVVSLDCDVK